MTLANFKNVSGVQGVPRVRRGELIRVVDEMTEGFEFLPTKDFPGLDSGLAKYYYDWLAHPDFDDYWKKLCIEDHHSEIEVPAMHVGGWYDIFLGGTIRNYMGMKESGANETARG